LIPRKSLSARIRRLATWDGFFTALQAADVPEDFLSEAQRAQGTHDRDPLEGWQG